MLLLELFNDKPLKLINEGGNLELPSGDRAQQIDLKVHDRGYIVPILKQLMSSIDATYFKVYNDHLWSPRLLSSGKFLSGSSLHFFDTNISDEQFAKVKPKVGDIDTQVDKNKEGNIEKFLHKIYHKKIGNAKFLGFERGNEQFSSLWELSNPPLKIQIDMEFVAFDNDEPTPWAQFSHSSAWEDIEAGVKGVFHKYLIQSFATLTKQEFYLRKAAGRGKARQLVDVLHTDNMISFAVSSKEGGGLRQKYEPVTDDTTGVALTKDGLPILKARPTEGYDQSLSSIFSKMFGKRLTPRVFKHMEKKFWSFKGLLEVMDKLLNREEKDRVVNSFIDKLFAKGSQGLYRNDPDRDIEEKMVAARLMFEILEVPPPVELKQMIKEYRDSYKMTESIDEAVDYSRKGIKHIYMPGSSAEMKDLEFLDLINEIHANGDKLDGLPVSLKVDGAGIRFGKDESGKPFMMTSRVNKPLYTENIGDFATYGKSVNQTPEQLARTRNYDTALSTIVNSDWIKKLPKDTIVQAEMLYNPMAQKTKDGLKFVNLPYDPKKLGTTMTLVPISFRRYSNGDVLPNATEIKDMLLKSSTPAIKFINNDLKVSNVDVSKIVAPVVRMGNELKTALSSRKKDDPLKAKAKEILTKVRKALSEAIIKNPNIVGKEALGKNVEGIVIKMPNGMMAKVTSPEMQAAMTAKIESRPKSWSKRVKPAVVTVGSFVGHIGHEHLVNKVLQVAKKVGGDPFVYISPKVGPEDPIPADVKIQTWKKLFPEHANMFQLIVGPDGSPSTPVKKIEKDLVLPRTSPYNKIILVVGSDRADSFKTWLNTLEKRMKDPVALAKFGGTQDQVEYEVISVPRSEVEGGNTMSFTTLRNVLKDPNTSEEQKLKVWSQGFDTKKLGIDWVKHLMDITEKGMGLAK